MKQITCAIVAIGSELLEGSVLDTNSNYLGANLSKHGFTVTDVRMVIDDKNKILNTFKELFTTHDIILTTGGLGPTFDDLTAEIFAIATERELKQNPVAYKHMADRLTQLGVTIGAGHLRQVELPVGCDLFDNNFGTALGFGTEYKGTYIASLPGVPFEMKYIFENHLIQFLIDRFKPEKIHFKDLIFASLPESVIDEDIRKFKPINTTIILNAGKAQLKVKLRGKDLEEIEKYAKILVDKYPNNFLGYNTDSIAKLLVDMCIQKKCTIGFAESCTGGMVSQIITDIAGSSEIFIGSIISYSNKIKINQLKVDATIIDTHGAVSSKCADAMAKGAKEVLGVDYSIAITGVAGPTGGTDDKPVGLVYIAISSDKNTVVFEERLKGDRESIRIRSANIALFKLLEIIKGL